MNIISQNFKDVLKNKIKVIISTNLYKYIGFQNSDKDIMVKCFVTFEDVKPVSKNRNQLSNRFVFSTCSQKP